MDSMNTERASSSSSSTHQLTYEVFLSFRGEDTRKTFTSHLYTALAQKGIRTFIDEEGLERGKSISPALLSAIEESRFAIVILSRRYASSTWCLDELAKIIKCMEDNGMTVYPVFYHVKPSEVRKQKRTFAEAFDTHENENKEKVQTWRAALRKVADASGWHITIRSDRSEAEVIQEIVKVTFNKLRPTFSVDTERLVGINARVEKLKSHLALESKDVCILGIWGTGGMGKTTLARVVYDMVSNQFEACSFIDNVRKDAEEKGLPWLQKELLKKLLRCKDNDVEDVSNRVLKQRLRHKKILLVLDDVNLSKQLDELAGNHDWFGLGSRVIITTRNKHLLKEHGANEIYEVEALNNDEALQLFSLKAFKKDHPKVDYMDLSQAFVRYSQGLPLALVVLGSFLFSRSKDEWKSALDRLKEYPKEEIIDVLRISYDGLHETEKQIFLYIACFFNHMNHETIIEILEYLELHPKIGLSVLKDVSLIKLQGNQWQMHDLLQEMGRHIVRQESSKNLGERSRLWLYKDIDNVLRNNTGTGKIEGIVLKLPYPKEVDWHPEAFSKLENLKLLIIDSVHLEHDLKHLPNNLIFFDWRKYPSKSLPSSFESNKLVKLCMNCSSIEKLWEGEKAFGSLKFIDLNKSKKLIETPNFSKVPYLEKLDLEDCTNLSTLHPSISFLKKLSILNLKGCNNLKNLPISFAMDSLEILTFSRCSKVRNIPEFGVNMKYVSKLYLDGTAVTKLPTSIGNLTRLTSLSARDCINLKSLPSTLFNLNSLENLNLSGCTKLGEQLEKLGMAKSVEELDVGGPDTRLMPSFNAIFNFFYLRLRNFYRIRSVSNSVSGLTSLVKLDLRYCNLNAISDDICCLSSLKYLDLSGNNFVCLPKSTAQLSFLRSLCVENCTSLRSLPKLPLNIGYINGYGCTSLETVPDLFEPNSSIERRLYLSNCNNLANNQGFMDMFLAGIIKHFRVSLSLFHSLFVFFPSLRSKHQALTTPGFPGDYVIPYMPHMYDIIFPGSEIPKWFSRESMGRSVKINVPSQLVNELVGIAVCVVFCSHPCKISCWLTANGKEMSSAPCIHKIDVFSDHTWLLYLLPEFYHEEERGSLGECDENGFSQISISLLGAGVKKCGLRVVCESDIKDLNRTMFQSSNNNSIPSEGLDSLNNFTALVKRTDKDLSEGLDDFTVTVESERISEHMAQNLDLAVINGHLVFAIACPKI